MENINKQTITAKSNNGGKTITKKSSINKNNNNKNSTNKNLIFFIPNPKDKL